MKNSKKIVYAVFAVGALSMVSCQNQDVSFPDFDYQTISFANQTPVQTITLGEDGEFDVTLDNQHCFSIYAVLGGINTNKKNRWADYVIDNKMVDGLEFEDGTPVCALPTNYYEVTSDPNRLYINKGKVLGGIDIHLTDAFFNDPKSVGVCYVVPVRLTASSDSILEGTLKDGEAGNVLDKDQWSVQPKNYTLYGIKYKNPYHGVWLSRRTVTVDGETKTYQDKNGYWENEDTVQLVSKSLTAVVRNFSNAVKVGSEELTLTCNVIFTVGNNGEVSMSTDTEGCKVSGSGKYTFHGAGNAWGALERDLFDVDYTYTIPYLTPSGETKTYEAHVQEKLVSRDRMNKFETFSYVIK